VMIRFGMWEQILAAPQPDKEYMPFTNAFHHAARAIAFAATGRTAEARVEQTLWTEGLKKIPEGSVFHNNPLPVVITLASTMLEGEILFFEGKSDAGLAKLREAVALEDALHYDEPPAWMIPARHVLGAALMKDGKVAEAEEVYRADLKKLPNNGWSLYGLADSLRKQGKVDEAKVVDAKFKEVWAKADIQITTSCLCQAGVATVK